jgi:hypothetical protein
MSKETLTIGLDAGVGPNPHGMVCAANENRFEGSHYNEPATNFLVGVLGAELQPLRDELNALAPAVRVGRRFEYKKNKKDIAFMADMDDARAIGASFAKIEDKRESVDAKTTNRGLTMTLDRDEMLDGDIEQTAQLLTAILLRNDIRRAVATLNAAATNADKTWNADALPDGDIANDLNTALIARGVMPNTVVAGSTAWLYRRSAYESSDKAGALLLANRTPAEVATALGVDKVHVSKTVYRDTKGGTKASLLANYVFMYYIDEIVSKEDGSNLKRFYTPCDGGEEFRVYVDETQAKTVTVTVEQYSLITAVDSGGIRKFTVAQS